MTDCSGQAFDIASLSDAPDYLTHLKRFPTGADWLTRLPSLLAAAVERFDLHNLQAPLSGGSVSLVLPAKNDSTDVILKLQFPHPESLHEAEALRRWNGEGAILLLDEARDLNALLLERCAPGHPLSSASPEIDQISVIVDIIRRLTIPASTPFDDLRETSLQWIKLLKEKPLSLQDHDFLRDAAVRILTELIKDSWSPVLLHQDLHGDNILAATRSDWLAIDPKPICGDPAFAIAPAVRSFELGHSRKDVFYRLDRLSEELGLDRQRARDWTIGQTIAWNHDSNYLNKHLETVSWLLNR